MFVTNWISTTKIQKISEITNFFRHYFLSRTEVTYAHKTLKIWRIWYSREKLYSQSIEVKSSGYKTHASLDAFCQKFSDRIVNPYLVYTKDLQKDGQTLLIPIYMTPFL